jgi:hypothetical protein
MRSDRRGISSRKLRGAEFSLRGPARLKGGAEQKGRATALGMTWSIFEAHW